MLFVKICDVTPVMRVLRRPLAPPPVRVAAGAGATIGPIRLIPKTLLACRDMGALALAGLLPASTTVPPLAAAGGPEQEPLGNYAIATGPEAAGSAGWHQPGFSGAPGFAGGAGGPASPGPGAGGTGDAPAPRLPRPELPPGELLFPPPSWTDPFRPPVEPDTMTDGTGLPTISPPVEVPEPSAAMLLLLPLAAVVLLRRRGRLARSASGA